MTSLKKILFIFSIAFFTLCGSAMAQVDPCTDPDVPCPIDGGTALLVAAGLAVGIRKARQQHIAAKSGFRI